MHCLNNNSSNRFSRSRNKHTTQFLVILLLSFGCIFLLLSIPGCGGYTEKYKSIPTDSLIASNEIINAKIDLNGVGIFINPENYFLVKSIGHVGPVIIPDKDGRFTSDYYPNQSQPPSYFIIELLIDPNGNKVSLDLSTLRLISNNDTYTAGKYWKVREAYWYSRERMSVQKRKEFDFNTRTRHKLCYNIDVFTRGSSSNDMNNMVMKESPKPVTRDLQLLDKTIPSCFILMFNIPPLNPQNEFLFGIGNILINDEIFTGTQTKFGFKKFKDYQMVLPGP
jgi:hypothetical protein